MSYPRPISPALRLVHTSPGDLVRLGPLGEATLFVADSTVRLREGEVVQCLRNDAHGVLVARSDGTRVLVPVKAAGELGVGWVPPLHGSSPSDPGPQTVTELPG